MNRMPVKNFWVSHREEPDPYYAGKDLYAINSDLTGWRNWLQKKLFRWIDKLGCHANKPMMVVHYRTPIEEGTLHDRIGKAVEASTMLYGKANTILIGPDEWAKLAQKDFELGVGWVSLNAETPAGYRQSRTILGLDVHIVPEIEGFIVIPGRISNDGRYTPEEMVHLGVTRAAPGLHDYMRYDNGKPSLHA